MSLTNEIAERKTFALSMARVLPAVLSIKADLHGTIFTYDYRIRRLQSRTQGPLS